jgi:membrane-bound lytic murein transglycosylase A
MADFNESAPENQLRVLRWLGIVALALVAGCKSPGPEKPAAPPAPAPVVVPVPLPEQPTAPAQPPPHLRATTWDALPGWQQDDPAEAWSALLASCSALARQQAWTEVCAAAAEVRETDRETARRFFEGRFAPFELVDSSGGAEGLITGYYEPLLRGSRRPSARYRYPVHGVPDDLLVVELSELHPELKGLRLRGRLEGRRIVPYYDRAQIREGKAAVRGREIAWVDNAVELFFLHVQGSGRIRLDEGGVLRVGYADHNGHPYRSIGRWLVEQGELPLERASMQGIKAWAQRNPGRMHELLNHNASYVFFRELPGDAAGPLGALGVPLSPRRSIAVDPGFVPLGAPVYLATTWPASDKPLNRLMFAQDTGSAIRGTIRADFFWGHGEDAAREAGRMKQRVRMWVLLPHGYLVPGK